MKKKKGRPHGGELSDPPEAILVQMAAITCQFILTRYCAADH
jgi:hypothetical protein